MRRTRLILSVHLLVAALLASGCFSAEDFGAKGTEAARCQVAEDDQQLSDQVLQLVNLERAEAGLPPVVMNPTLKQVASDYACRMVDEGFFGHRDPVTGYGPGERAALGRYSFFAVGENLAAGQETPADVMRVWMESDSHKAIILDERWREVGIAVRFGGEYSVYWVQEFGDPTGY